MGGPWHVFSNGGPRANKWGVFDMKRFWNTKRRSCPEWVWLSLYIDKTCYGNDECPCFSHSSGHQARVVWGAENDWKLSSKTVFWKSICLQPFFMTPRIICIRLRTPHLKWCCPRDLPPQYFTSNDPINDMYFGHQRTFDNMLFQGPPSPRSKDMNWKCSLRTNIYSKICTTFLDFSKIADLQSSWACRSAIFQRLKHNIML